MFYFEIRPSLNLLSLEQKGKLFEAILDYAQYGVVPEFESEPLLGMAWCFITPRLDKDRERYQQISESRARAGRIGGSSRRKVPEANAFFDKQTKPTTTTTPTTTSTTDSASNIQQSDTEGGVGGESTAGILPSKSEISPDSDNLETTFETMRQAAITKLMSAQ